MKIKNQGVILLLVNIQKPHVFTFGKLAVYNYYLFPIITIGRYFREIIALFSSLKLFEWKPMKFE